MMNQEQTDETKGLNPDLAMAQPVHQNFNIPVHVTDLSTFDDSFSFLKARFQAEMDRVTEEMNKFSVNVSRLYQTPTPKEAGPRIKSAASRTSEPSAAHTENKDQVFPPGLNMKAKGMSAQATWAAISESPLILQEGDSRKLKLQFDVSQFDPPEVKVQFLNDIIYVKAKHDERTESSLVLREYNQQFMLPKGVDPETILTSLSRDGVLNIEIPLPPTIMQLFKEGAGYKKPNAPFPKKKSELQEASAPANPVINPPATDPTNPPENAPANSPAREREETRARRDKRSS